MSKIGSVNIGLLRPEFAEANKLFGSSMDALTEAPTPFKEAMANNFAYMQQQKAGELTNLLQQQAPQDPSDPMAMQQYMQQATDMAQDNGFNKWGINAGGAVSTANALVDRNQEVDKLQGANTLTNLANLNTADKRKSAMIRNRAGAEDWNNNTTLRAFAEAGLGVDGQDMILDSQGKAVKIAGEVNDREQFLANNSHLLRQIPKEIQANIAAGKQLSSNEIKELERIWKYAGGDSMGKTQGVEGVPSSYTNNAPIADAKTYAPIVKKYAQESGVSPSLINAMIHTESTFNPNARSAVGAQGLMQLMPGTAKDLKVSNPFNPEDNIRGGTKYIAQQLKTFGDVDTALMAYNWGPGNTQNWIDAGRDPNKIPKETREYINKVKGRMGAYGTGATLGVKPSDSSNLNVAPYTKVRASDYIKESNKGATRNQPLAPKLADTVAPALAKHGLTWNVASGGQPAKGSGGNRVGSTAHDHGNSGDGDIFDKKTGRKLSFNNPEDQKRIAALVEDLAAQGITGIGGHTDYMGDGRLHIGFQNNPRVWGGTNGEAGNSNTYSWMTEAFNRGRSNIGGSVNTGDAGYSALMNSLKMTSGNPNITRNNEDLLNMLKNSSNEVVTMQANSPKVDLDSSGLGFIGELTGGASNAKTLFDAQNRFAENDRAAASYAMDSANQARTADIDLSSAAIDVNYNNLDKYKANVARIMQEQAANAQPMKLSSFIGTDTRLEEGKSLLESAGFTQERMASLPPEVQSTILSTTNQYLDKKQEFRSKNNIKLNKMKEGLYKYDPTSKKSPVEQFPEAYLNASIKNLDETSKKDYMKWLEEEDWIDKGSKIGMKVVIPPFTFTETKTTANQRVANMKALHKDMIERVINVAASSGGEYETTLRNADIAGIAKRAKEIYTESLKLDDKADVKDINGYSKRLVNPGLFAEATKRAMQENHEEKEKDRSKLREDPSLIPLAEQIEANLRKDTINEYS